MPFELHVYHHPAKDHEVPTWAGVLNDKLDLISKQLEKIMHTLDETLAEVTGEGTQLDSLTAFVQGLEKQVADALAGTTLPAAVQAKIDAVFDGVETNKAKVQAALNAGTPAAAVNPATTG